MKAFKYTIACFTVCLGLAVCNQAHAQTPPPPPPNPAAVPIDGGLSLLLAAGAGLGMSKAWKNRKNTL